MQLQDRIVIATGGAAGIGGAILRVLVRRGAEVVRAARSFLAARWPPLR